MWPTGSTLSWHVRLHRQQLATSTAGFGGWLKRLCNILAQIAGVKSRQDNSPFHRCSLPLHTRVTLAASRQACLMQPHHIQHQKGELQVSLECWWSFSTSIVWKSLDFVLGSFQQFICLKTNSSFPILYPISCCWNTISHTHTHTHACSEQNGLWTWSSF